MLRLVEHKDAERYLRALAERKGGAVAVRYDGTRHEWSLEEALAYIRDAGCLWEWNPLRYDLLAVAHLTKDPQMVHFAVERPEREGLPLT